MALGLSATCAPSCGSGCSSTPTVWFKCVSSPTYTPFPCAGTWAAKLAKCWEASTVAPLPSTAYWGQREPDIFSGTVWHVVERVTTKWQSTSVSSLALLLLIFGIISHPSPALCPVSCKQNARCEIWWHYRLFVPDLSSTELSAVHFLDPVH